MHLKKTSMSQRIAYAKVKLETYGVRFYVPSQWFEGVLYRYGCTCIEEFKCEYDWDLANEIMVDAEQDEAIVRSIEIEN